MMVPKSTPAIGALKVAEIPPAAPQATRSTRWVEGTRNHCTFEEPSADPICTMGPSRPTEPLMPMHSTEARDLTTATLAGIRLRLRATANIASGAPWPRPPARTL